MRFAFASLALVAGCATSPPRLPPRRVTFASPPAEPVRPPPDLAQAAEPPLIRERYMAWMLAADAVGLVPLTYWIVKPGQPYYALPSLLLPPLVHAAHGESSKAVASFAMRAAMVGVVYLAGRAAETECRGSSSLVCVPLGSLVLAQTAIVTAVVIDAVLLAQRTRQDERWLRLPVQPAVGVAADGRPWLSLRGAF